MSIKFITKGSEKQESIIGYYDTKMEALEAYDQAEQYVRHSHHKQVASNKAATNSRETDEALKEIFNNLLNGEVEKVKDETEHENEKVEEDQIDSSEQLETSMILTSISLQNDVDKLKYELEKSLHNENVLKMRLNRRTEVLDAVRGQYLRDVVLVKEQFYGNHNNLEKYSKNAASREIYNGLPQNILKRMLPRFDLRNSLPCFGPGNDLYLHIKPCRACGGCLEVMVYPDDRIEFLIEKYKELNGNYKKLESTNEKNEEASDYMLKQIRGLQYDVKTKDNEIDELRHILRIRNESDYSDELEKLMKIKYKKLMREIATLY